MKKYNLMKMTLIITLFLFVMSVLMCLSLYYNMRTIITDMTRDLNSTMTMVQDLTEQVEIKDQMIDELQQDNDMLRQQVDRLKRVDSAQYIKAVVAAEAGGSTFEDKCAVLQTMIDRSYLWNESIINIAKAPGQYTDPKYGRIDEEIELAFEKTLVEGQRVFKDNVTHFATYKPYWADSKQCRGRINRHYYWGD